MGSVASFAAAEPAGGKSNILSYRELELQERRNLLAALERTNWKVFGAGGAADLLGVKPTTLSSRIKAMGLKRPQR